MRRFVGLIAVLAAIGAACTREPADDPFATTPPPTTSAPSPSPSPSVVETSPTPPAIPDPPPPTSGPVTETCVNGWKTPPSDSPDFTDPLGLIRRATGVEGTFHVVDMRHFTGPESPPSQQGYLLDVERWYIKLFVEEDLSFQGRFLVEARRFGRGLVAVAPYDTSGFRSPDWRAFQFDSGHTARRQVPGLPGTWSGIEYDFVTGGEGLTIPGLPDEVGGCLDGT
jgi:hypothetical protein